MFKCPDLQILVCSSLQHGYPCRRQCQVLQVGWAFLSLQLSSFRSLLPPQRYAPACHTLPPACQLAWAHASCAFSDLHLFLLFYWLDAWFYLQLLHFWAHSTITAAAILPPSSWNWKCILVNSHSLPPLPGYVPFLFSLPVPCSWQDNSSSQGRIENLVPH